MNSSRLYVGNLNNATDDRQLKKLFSPYGRVVSIDKSRDFGYVIMENNLQAKNAREALNFSNFKGSIIIVISSNTD